MLCCLAWAFLSAKVTKPLVVERIELCPEEGKSNLYIFNKAPTLEGNVVNIWQYSHKYFNHEILVSLAAQCVETFIRGTDIADKGGFLICQGWSELTIL